MVTVPVVEMSAAGMAAVNCPELENVVVRALPFHRTTELGTKFEPFTVRVNVAPPATAVVGESAVNPGTGFDATIAKASAVEVPPPGAELNTVTWAMPAAAMSAAEIEAVNWVPLRNVVLR